MGVVAAKPTIARQAAGRRDFHTEFSDGNPHSAGTMLGLAQCSAVSIRTGPARYKWLIQVNLFLALFL